MNKIKNIGNFIKVLVKYAGYFVIVFETLQFLSDKIENYNETKKLEK